MMRLSRTVFRRCVNQSRPSKGTRRYVHNRTLPNGSSSPSHKFPFPLAFGGFAAVAGGWVYRKRQREEQNKTSTPEALRVLGHVLYSIVSEERGVEGKVTYLLQELTKNPATHGAIAATQAIPLLLRAATSTTQQTTTKPLAANCELALQALDNLSKTEHVVESIVIHAFKTNTLVRLLEILSNGSAAAPNLTNALDTLTLASSVGVRATSQNEVDTITKVIENTNMEPVRRFALRTLEDTIRHCEHPFVIDWERILSFNMSQAPSIIEDPRNDAALLSLLFTATTEMRKGSTSNVSSFIQSNLTLDMVVGGNSCNSLLIDILVKWSSQIPITLESALIRRTSSRNYSNKDNVKLENERISELCQSFAVRTLSNLTFLDESAPKLLNETRMGVLSISHRQCQKMFSKMKVLPPGSSLSIHIKEIQQNTFHLANIIRNCVVSTTMSCDGEATRRIWGDATIQWLSNEDDVMLQSLAADIIVQLTKREKNEKMLLKSQYTLLEQYLRVMASIMGEQLNNHLRRRVYNELKQGNGKNIKKMIKRHATRTNVTQQFETNVQIMKEHDKNLEHKTGNSSAQSHAFKAMAIVFESPEDVLLLNKENENEEKEMKDGIQSALKTFVNMKGWDAIENLMEESTNATVSTTSTEEAVLDNDTEYVHSILHDQVTKNCVRMLGNMLSCDIAWFNGKILQPTLQQQGSVKNKGSRYNVWMNRFTRLSRDTCDKRNRTDIKIMHHAIRALRHLSCYSDPSISSLTDASEQKYLLYPDHLFPVHENNQSQLFQSFQHPLHKGQKKVQHPVADVIFVHGLSGGAFATWQTESTHEDSILQNVNQFWPKQFFAVDFERKSKMQARVLTFGYEARPLRPTNINSTSSSIPLDLEEQAEILLRKLKLAKIGESGGPVVFVTHSLGGLLVKKMLILAHEKSLRNARENQEVDYSDLVKNTTAVVFYSVPHKGSPLMDMMLQPKDILINMGVANGHPIVKWLLSNYPPSLEMNTKFGEIFGNCSLSLGETKKEPLEGLIDLDMGGMSEMLNLMFDDSGLIQIVPRESSNPGFGLFEEIKNCSHTVINKPTGMKDRRYLAMVEFVTKKCQGR